VKNPNILHDSIQCLKCFSEAIPTGETHGAINYRCSNATCRARWHRMIKTPTVIVKGNLMTVAAAMMEGFNSGPVNTSVQDVYTDKPIVHAKQKPKKADAPLIEPTSRSVVLLDD
jgi:hypothetical protein